ncbi:MAG: diguanylate cyclase [bacterium]|nr:diguanylate cyclase [Gammaproteobacteria bacterium]
MTLDIEDIDVSRTIPFQGVNPASIKEWIDQCKVQAFDEGEILLQPGENNEFMFVILEGEVGIYLDQESEEAIITFGQGECVGEMSLLDGQSPSAFVKAKTKLKALAIEGEVLLNLIDNSNGVARNFLYLLINRLRSGNEAANARREAQAGIEAHASVDILTGLHNLRWINDYFSRLLEHVVDKIDFPDITILVLDIDDFKEFNEDYDQLAGDHVLRNVSYSLQDSIRPTDMAARTGGGEFLVILPETVTENALVVAERIRSNVENKIIDTTERRYPPVTVSLGVAQLLIDDAFEDVFNAAEQAMYVAKKDGRNQVSVSDR